MSEAPKKLYRPKLGPQTAAALEGGFLTEYLSLSSTSPEDIEYILASTHQDKIEKLVAACEIGLGIAEWTKSCRKHLPTHLPADIQAIRDAIEFSKT